MLIVTGFGRELDHWRGLVEDRVSLTPGEVIVRCDFREDNRCLGAKLVFQHRSESPPVDTALLSRLPKEEVPPQLRAVAPKVTFARGEFAKGAVGLMWKQDHLGARSDPVATDLSCNSRTVRG